MTRKRFRKGIAAFLLWEDPAWATAVKIPQHTTWSVDCDDGPQLMIEDHGNGVMKIASNQVYIRFMAERVNDDTYSLKYVRPEDLGRGGLTLDWASVSKEVPVATLQIETSNRIKLTWIGFATFKKSNTTKLPKPIFYEPGGMHMARCPLLQ